MTLPAISVQLYSVRGPLESDPVGTISRIADIGLRQVEAGFRYLTQSPALAAAIREYQLATPTLTSPLVDVDRSAAFDLARQIGAHTVVETFVPEPKWTSIEDVQHIADELNAAASEASAFGLRIGYHNHWWELERVFGGERAFDALVERLDPSIVLEVDAYWVAVGGEDPVAFVDRHADRVRYLHLKDGPVSRDNHEQVAAGRGRLPIDRLLRAARNLEAAVIEFDDYPGDVFEAIAQSFAYLSDRKVDA